MKPHFYIDVDGVLADIIGGLEVAFNRDIAPWFQHYPDTSLRKILGFPTTDAIFQRLNWVVPDFWETLPRLNHAIELLQFIQTHSTNTGSTWSFLTSPPAGIASFQIQRTNWLNSLVAAAFDNMIPGLKVEIQFSNMKQEVIWGCLKAGKRPVLIDDHLENVQAFTKSGGLGLLFPAITNDLREQRHQPLPTIKIILDTL